MRALFVVICCFGSGMSVGIATNSKAWGVAVMLGLLAIVTAILPKSEL